MAGIFGAEPSLAVTLASVLSAGRVVLHESLNWLVAISKNQMLVAGQIRSLCLYGAKGVVTGYHQDHVRSIERIPGDKD